MFVLFSWILGRLWQPLILLPNGSWLEFNNSPFLSIKLNVEKTDLMILLISFFFFFWFHILSTCLNCQWVLSLLKVSSHYESFIAGDLYSTGEGKHFTSFVDAEKDISSLVTANMEKRQCKAGCIPKHHRLCGWQWVLLLSQEIGELAQMFRLFWPCQYSLKTCSWARANNSSMVVEDAVSQHAMTSPQTLAGTIIMPFYKPSATGRRWQSVPLRKINARY